MRMERMITLSQRINLSGLQRTGAKVLLKIAYEIVGSRVAFKNALADKLDCQPYSVARYMESLTQRLLMQDFDLLERGIQEVLDACSKEDNFYDVRAEKVKLQRKRFEQKFMQELRELHEEAIQRCIGK